MCDYCSEGLVLSRRWHIALFLKLQIFLWWSGPLMSQKSLRKIRLNLITTVSAQTAWNKPVSRRKCFTYGFHTNLSTFLRPKVEMDYFLIQMYEEMRRFWFFNGAFVNKKLLNALNNHADLVKFVMPLTLGYFDARELRLTKRIFQFG